MRVLHYEKNQETYKPVICTRVLEQSYLHACTSLTQLYEVLFKSKNIAIYVATTYKLLYQTSDTDIGPPCM